MSLSKKKTRAAFRDAVFARDRNKCRCCSMPAVDAHHITDRNEMPNGGYVVENGVSVCERCHLRAERGEISARELYARIGSSYDRAVAASEKLSERV